MNVALQNTLSTSLATPGDGVGLASSCCMSASSTGKVPAMMPLSGARSPLSRNSYLRARMRSAYSAPCMRAPAGEAGSAASAPAPEPAAAAPASADWMPGSSDGQRSGKSQ
jgi:hypothetical protein